MGILVLSIVGLLVSFQQEGALSIRRGFEVRVYDDASKLRTLPPPIITDLDGDGKNEVLLLTTRETLAIVNPSKVRRHQFEFMDLQAKVEAPFVANCIGFSTGYVEKYNKTKEKARKQVCSVYRRGYDHTTPPTSRSLRCVRGWGGC